MTKNLSSKLCYDSSLNLSDTAVGVFMNTFREEKFGLLKGASINHVHMEGGGGLAKCPYYNIKLI